MLTVERTSIFSTQTRTIVIILLADLLPSVKADCWIDSDGFEHCKRSLASRLGIAVASSIFISILAWSLGTCGRRRRRAAVAKLANAQKNQQNGESANNGSSGQPPNAPRYPPQAHSGPDIVFQYAYDPNTGFAPPARSPPQYYMPPPGAPLVEHPRDCTTFDGVH
ncbi:hypothetical protein EDB87DRAFT_752195 [Lactarius vividus]|nr:hypothetical protein EDB87DRAFT_752195 [Lactarius vividus]